MRIRRGLRTLAMISNAEGSAPQGFSDSAQACTQASRICRIDLRLSFLTICSKSMLTQTMTT